MWGTGRRRGRHRGRATGSAGSTTEARWRRSCVTWWRANPKAVAQFKAGKTRAFGFVRRPGDEGDARAGEPRHRQRAGRSGNWSGRDAGAKPSRRHRLSAARGGSCSRGPSCSTRSRGLTAPAGPRRPVPQLLDPRVGPRHDHPRPRGPVRRPHLRREHLLPGVAHAGVLGPPDPAGRPARAALPG